MKIKIINKNKIIPIEFKNPKRLLKIKPFSVSNIPAKQNFYLSNKKNFKRYFFSNVVSICFKILGNYYLVHYIPDNKELWFFYNKKDWDIKLVNFIMRYYEDKNKKK